MKKAILVVVFIVGPGVTLCAQPSKKKVFGAGIRFGLPVNDFKEFASFSIGAELQGEYYFSDIIAGVATMGYSSFLGKDYGGGKTKATSYFPVLVGARVYPVSRFFLGAQVGYGLLTSGRSSESYFNYQPQIGYNASSLQVVLHYNGLSKNEGRLNHIAITGIYKF